MNKLKHFVLLCAYFLLLCATNSLFAQIKGKVVDENNKPIPYVTISVQGEAIGTTSDEDGSFYLPVKEAKNLVFSSLGFEKKIVKSSETTLVTLQSSTLALGEVFVSNKKETKTFELFGTKGIAQAFENGPKIDAILFPYSAKVKKNRYIKKVSLFTESAIESASVRIHFYAVSQGGLPGEELLTKDLIVNVKKGSRKSYFDVSNYNLSIPKEGIFVSVERLFIEKNKYTKTSLGVDGSTKAHTVYYPLLYYNSIERDYSYTFYGGNWYKEFKKSTDNSILPRVFEPAITLILTN